MIHDEGTEAVATSISDDELAAQALAADPDAPVGADVVPLWQLLGQDTGGPLPTWYMPPPMSARRFDGWYGRIIRCSVFSVIASFVVINAYGLCNTYGQLHL